MPGRKIQDEQEVLRWFKENRSYQWMTDEYRRKYNIETVPSLWSNFRRRRGLDRRYSRDDELIPWHALPKHKARYPIQMLRAEARRRTGHELSEDNLNRLLSWLDFMQENNVVVHYDPELDEGFVYVPRESGDTDLIRAPARPTKQRLAAD